MSLAPETSPKSETPDKGAIISMHPIELQQKWNLSNTQLALVLGKTEETVKSYKARETARSYRKPTHSTIILCSLIDKEWERVGTAQIQLIAG